MAEKNKTIESVHLRRSVSPRLLKLPTQSAEQLIEIIGAAGAAPDHGRLDPVRFILIPKDQRETLATVF